MSFSAIFAMLARRWYLVLIAILASAALAVGGFKVTKASYEARADVLLLPAARSAGTNGGLGNPYLALNDSLGQAAQVVAAHVSSDQTAQRLGGLGGTAVYTVTLDTAFSAPVGADHRPRCIARHRRDDPEDGHGRVQHDADSTAGAGWRADPVTCPHDRRDYYSQAAAPAQDAHPQCDRRRRSRADRGPAADSAPRTTSHRAHQAQAGAGSGNREGRGAAVEKEEKEDGDGEVAAVEPRRRRRLLRRRVRAGAGVRHRQRSRGRSREEGRLGRPAEARADDQPRRVKRSKQSKRSRRSEAIEAGRKNGP